MIHLILKNQIEQSKLDVLLSLLKSWDIDTEIKATAKRVKKTVSKSGEKTDENFPLTFGLWKDRDIDAKELRRQASGIDKRLGLTDK
ncbi:MAG: hypothetical protein LBQ78_03725 [Tannerellaceae bacterium]|jgi:hypothetical protein|nr:hypothetical protein [Tannerellaceae bacterium]